MSNSTETDIKTLQNNTENKEITLESDKLYDVLFKEPGSQFESQFFLSRKRALKEQNGENQFEAMLELKLKALEMYHLLLLGNKNIDNFDDVVCIEEFNNLISASKKSIKLQEHFISKIKSILSTLIIKYHNQNGKSKETSEKIMKFFLFLLNLKFDMTMFTHVFSFVKKEEEML